jgi:hypothetical protein
MSTSSIIELLMLLQLKHLLIDWCWQPAYEWQNKGTYGHFGGVRHAAKNATGTALCFLPFTSFFWVLVVFILDFTIHYHIDSAKMNINRIKGWGPLTHPEFWWLTGADQFLHQMTYLLLVLMLS